MLAGIGVSIFFWARLARRDDRLVTVYVGALMGAFLGAKITYLIVDGWRHIGQPDVWLQLATGKTILGALPGGYLGVEIAKKLTGYSETTGDSFALIAPVSIMLGRIGCLSHGCCQGRVCSPGWFTLQDSHGTARWPSVPTEILFNLMMVMVFVMMRRFHKLPGQHFHIYLISYGVFRFFHEFLRNEAPLVGAITGYQIVALTVAGFGAVAFQRRQRTLQGPSGRNL